MLHRPVSARDPVEIARQVAGIQAQDQPASRLSFRSRSRSLTAADVDRARNEERSLLRTWVMRMTIHLIPTDDAGWMLPLFEPGIERWSRRRLGQLGLSDAKVAKAHRTVAKALADEGPLTRTETAERVGAAGVELNQQTRLHTMLTAVVSGIAVLGPDDRLVRREDWLGRLPPFDADAAIAELARRYLRAFGPASDRDFAYWSGLGLTQVRAGLSAIADEIEESDGLLSLRGTKPRLPRAGWVRLLGAFDTYLLGYEDRGFCVTPEQAKAVKEGGGGWIRPVIVRDGVVVGGWRSSRRSGRIEVSLDLQEPELRGTVEEELGDIARFESAQVVSA
ncbi:MAG TPA: winged helix DNA-binding domain-containing protein [Thermoleophilaceae bacterium]